MTMISPARPLRNATPHRQPPGFPATQLGNHYRIGTDPSDLPQVAIVDGSDVVRSGLPLILTGFAFPVVCSSIRDFLRGRPAAEVVVFGFDGRGAAPPSQDDSLMINRLDRAGYRVCVYTCETRPALLARCVRAGARGIVLKTDPVKMLANAILAVRAGGTAISESVAAAIGLATQTPDLTKRQVQVLTARARGETFQSIAGRLNISERTAQDHWTAIARRYEEFLRHNSAADLERSLGLDMGAAPLDGYLE